MASGSHTWSGNWALLPIAPMKSATPAQKRNVASVVPPPPATTSMMSVNRNEPTDRPIMIAR